MDEEDWLSCQQLWEDMPDLFRRGWVFGLILRKE
jgi:hypothetical protein